MKGTEIFDGSKWKPAPCEDFHKGNCQGEVDWRCVNPNTFRHRVICEKHQEDRLKTYERTLELTSPMRANWFDESYAGERWDEDNY